MNNEEIWKPVTGYEGLYEVSNDGRVKSLNYRHTGKTKERKAVKDGRGYLQVNLCKDGKSKFHRIHRLVYETFNGSIPAGMEINHLDENKLNNWLENLEVCTHKENNNYGTRTERMAKTQTNHPSKSKAVQQIDKVTGKILNTYPSTREAERQTGIKQQSIVQCCLCNRNSAGGYKWRYAENNNPGNLSENCQD